MEAAMERYNSNSIKAEKQEQVESPFSSNEWEQMFDSLEHSAMILDHTHKVLFVNSATQKLLKKNSNQLVGKKCYEIFHGTVNPIDGCPMEKLLSNKKQNKVNAQVDEAGHNFMVSCSPVFINGEKNPKIFHLALDISERIKAEEQAVQNAATQELISYISTKVINSDVENTNNIFSNSLEKIGDFFKADRGFLFLFDSKKCKISEKHEWRREGIGPHIDNFLELSCEKDLPWFANKINKIKNIYIAHIKQSSMSTAEKQYFIKQGIHSLLAVPICYKQKLYGFIQFDYVTFKSIDCEKIFPVLQTVGEIMLQALANKEAHLNLKRERDFLDLLMNNIPDNIYFKDNQLRFTKINNSQAKALGINKPEDAIGKRDGYFFESNFGQQAQLDENAIIVNNKIIKDKEEKVIRSDGKLFWASATKVPLIDDMGENHGIVGISRDITERVLRRKKNENINKLTTYLLGPDEIFQKLKNVLDKMVETLDLSFARIWLVRPGDICDTTCRFGPQKGTASNCKNGHNCLHLVASSGNNTRLNGSRKRIPIGYYKVGKTANSPELKVVSNDITNDTLIEYPNWAKKNKLKAFSGFRLKAEDNSTLGVIGIFSKHKISTDDASLLGSLSHDISQVLFSYNSKMAIKYSEIKFRALFDDAPIGYHELDKDGIIVNVNKTELDLLGYSAGEMIGKPVWTFACGNTVKKRVLSKLSNGRASKKGFETTILTKDGRTLPIFVYDKILQDEYGKFIGIRSTLQDNSARKKAETKLSESEEKFRSISQAATDAIISADQSGNVIFWNSAAFKIFGFTENEILGQSVEMLMPLSYRKIHSGALQKIKNGHKPTVMDKAVELVGRHKNGKEFPIELSVSTWKASGQYYFSAIVRNIEQRKTIEKQLQQSHKMEAIGTLAGGIAHDFNNILGAIMGYAELSIDDVDPKSITNENLKKLLISANRAKDLVKQILLYSRMDDYKSQPLQIHETVNETLDLLRATIPTTIRFNKNIQADKSLIMGDSGQIHQILLNLCNNAVQAIGNRAGTLAVTLKVVSEKGATNGTPTRKKGEYVKLAITDNGCGMHQSILDKIFDPFFTTKDVGEGTGLGLSVIKGIIEKMNGYINVKSKIDFGTTFTVFFPSTQEKATKDIITIAGEPTGDESILLVDDEIDLVDITKTKLEKLGYTVTCATDCMKALELFQNNADKFDVVITDQAMPVMTGKELSKSILKIRPNIPIILWTGYSDTIDETEALDLGIKRFMYKPVNIRDLVGIVRDVLDVKIPTMQEDNYN
jgi:PAS domain S-box-containing protein